jgi:hypothetical protein
MVFGQNKRQPIGIIASVLAPSIQVSQTKVSYRRPIQPAVTITRQAYLQFRKQCSYKGRTFKVVMLYNRYEEDISSARSLTPDYRQRAIGRGFCRRCSSSTTAHHRVSRVVTPIGRSRQAETPLGQLQSSGAGLSGCSRVVAGRSPFVADASCPI